MGLFKKSKNDNKKKRIIMFRISLEELEKVSNVIEYARNIKQIN